MKKIRILIADDSKTIQALLTKFCETEIDMQVIGHAKDGAEAIRMTQLLKPDLITMDINMPLVNGFEATKVIMTTVPTPIVMISAQFNNLVMKTVFQALDAGALDVLPKPDFLNLTSLETQRRHILTTLRMAAKIKVRLKQTSPTQKTETKQSLPLKHKYDIVVIGASTGGPAALKTILAKISPDFPIPIVVVQHMAEGFSLGFSQWLNDSIALSVNYTVNHEILLPGHVYIAPDKHHLTIFRHDNRLQVKLVDSEAVHGFCPSISKLFNSTAHTCGKNAIGVLLTGMGEDGADGLLNLKNKGAHTIIQDKESSVVFGMGKVAQALGAVDKYTQRIAFMLTHLL
jgi:two-component system chemotaxis response regulator CheB